MAQEPKEGGGALFPNKKKNEKSKDYYGQIKHLGVIIPLSGWIRTGPYGQFISVGVDQFRWREQQGIPHPKYPREVKPSNVNQHNEFDDNTIPF